VSRRCEYVIIAQILTALEARMLLREHTFNTRTSIPVQIGHVTVGGRAPVVVQSMTNTDTADIEAAVKQVAALAEAGSELVRITVNNDAAAKAVPHIRERLDKMGINVPLIGDFHDVRHTLHLDNPDCASALAKYRNNPGNIGFDKKRDKHVCTKD